MPNEDKDFKSIHVDYAISPQPHTQMYLMHKYWARKPHNVVGEYIEHYSRKDEIVLDPFVGSGVTAIEALKLGRKAIAIDLDPISTFITKMTLIPVDLKQFRKRHGLDHYSRKSSEHASKNWNRRTLYQPFKAALYRTAWR